MNNSSTLFTLVPAAVSNEGWSASLWHLSTSSARQRLRHLQEKDQQPSRLTYETWLSFLKWLEALLLSTLEKSSTKSKSSLKWLVTTLENSRWVGSCTNGVSYTYTFLTSSTQMTYKPVKHGRPGIGATNSSRLYVFLYFRHALIWCAHYQVMSNTLFFSIYLQHSPQVNYHIYMVYVVLLVP